MCKQVISIDMVDLDNALLNITVVKILNLRTNVRKFPRRFQGPKIFNSINDKIKNSLSLTEFISKLKSTFLD